MLEGRYANVQTCTSKSNDQEYFVRVINKAQIFWKDDTILREIKILTKLKHEHVMTVIDKWETADDICMVMESTEVQYTHPQTLHTPFFLHHSPLYTHTHTQTHLYLIHADDLYSCFPCMGPHTSSTPCSYFQVYLRAWDTFLW